MTAYGEACAHLQVKYDPIDHGSGTFAQRWCCDLCRMEFIPDSPYYGRRGWRLWLAKLIWHR